MTTVELTRAELKAACLELLDRAAVEHPAGHQGKLAARYILRSAGGDRIGVMFEKGDKTKAYLWLDQRSAGNLADAGIESRLYPASSLYQLDEASGKPAYGRHAALKSMRDLAHADLVRFTISQQGQLETILTALAADHKSRE